VSVPPGHSDVRFLTAFIQEVRTPTHFLKIDQIKSLGLILALNTCSINFLSSSADPPGIGTGERPCGYYGITQHVKCKCM